MVDLGGIADVVGEIVEGVAGGAAKLGKSASAQVSGQPASGQGQAPSQQGQNQPAATEAINPVVESRKFSDEIVSQITGGEKSANPAVIAQKKAEDDQFKEEQIAIVRERIKRIYEEHEARKKQAGVQEEVVEEQEEEEKQEIKQLEKKEEMDVSVAQAKSSAENRNYGAE